MGEECDFPVAPHTVLV